MSAGSGEWRKRGGEIGQGEESEGREVSGETGRKGAEERGSVSEEDGPDTDR